MPRSWSGITLRIVLTSGHDLIYLFFCVAKTVYEDVVFHMQNVFQSLDYPFPDSLNSRINEW